MLPCSAIMVHHGSSVFCGLDLPDLLLLLALQGQYIWQVQAKCPTADVYVAVWPCPRATP